MQALCTAASIALIYSQGNAIARWSCRGDAFQVPAGRNDSKPHLGLAQDDQLVRPGKDEICTAGLVAVLVDRQDNLADQRAFRRKDVNAIEAAGIDVALLVAFDAIRRATINESKDALVVKLREPLLRHYDIECVSVTLASELKRQRMQAARSLHCSSP